MSPRPLPRPCPIALCFDTAPGVVGGSELYIGRLIAGLNPARWQPYLVCRSGYDVDGVLEDPSVARVLRFDPGTPPALPRGPDADADGGSAVAAEAVGAPAPGARRLVRELWRQVPQPLRTAVGELRDGRRFAQLLAAHDIRLVQTVMAPDAAVIAARRASWPLVVSLLWPPPERPARSPSAWPLRKGARRAAACLVKSEYARGCWQRWLRAAPRRFEVIGNGLDPATLPAADVAAARRGELGLAPDAPVVVMAGRLHADKGVGVLVEALPRLLRRHADLVLVMVGDGPARRPAERRLEVLGLSDRVRFVGWRDDVPAWLAMADVAVVPSVWEEFFGWVVIEAMAVGTPVVASRSGGIPEVLDDGGQGLLVPPGDVGALSDAVAGLLADPARRRALGDAGRRRVAEQFTLARMAARHEALYDSLLGVPTSEGCTA